MKLYIDRFTNIDFSYICPQKGLLGQSLWVSLVLDGQLNEEGMVLDFGVVKPLVKSWLDENIDHTLVVPSFSSKVTSEKEQYNISFDYPNGNNLFIGSPKPSVYIIDCPEISIAVLEQHLNDKLLSLLPKAVKGITLKLEEDDSYKHYFTYSHGLKLHKGNCQRIAHGHRSAILIKDENGKLSGETASWARELDGKFIADRSLPCSVETNNNGERRLTFSYSAPQGEFNLTIPDENVYLIDSDVPTTIETICLHIKNNIPKGHSVKIFEGVNKGALLD